MVGGFWEPWGLPDKESPPMSWKPTLACRSKAHYRCIAAGKVGQAWPGRARLGSLVISWGILCIQVSPPLPPDLPGSSPPFSSETHRLPAV